jgi:hypothetical protein
MIRLIAGIACLALALWLLIGCDHNSYYAQKRTFTAIAIATDGPIPCDDDNCGKRPNE